LQQGGRQDAGAKYKKEKVQTSYSFRKIGVMKAEKMRRARHVVEMRTKVLLDTMKAGADEIMGIR
jgi:hypothetical protein